MSERVRHRPRYKHNQRGMTLIEVLVAFAILSGLVLSVLSLLGQNTQYMLTAEERLLASVAADNLLTNDLARRETPGPGETDGQIIVAERAFAFTRTIFEIGGQGVLIQYEVRRDGSEQTLSRVSAFKEQQP